MKKNNNKTIENFDIDNMRILDPKALKLKNTDSGYLDLDFEGKTYKQVSLIRLIPFFERNKYISVSYQDDDKEWHEIGIIKDIDECEKNEREIITSYLDYRYFIPVITKIYSMAEKVGYLYIDAETTAGRKFISINDWWSNFRLRDNNTLNITDADGNRYFVPEVGKMDSKSLRQLQLFI